VTGREPRRAGLRAAARTSQAVASAVVKYRSCDDSLVGEVADAEIVRLRREVDRLRAENGRLSRLLDLRGQDTAPAPEQLSAALSAPGLVTMASPAEDKLALYADRFRARTDVYAVRWDNARTGVSGGCRRWQAACLRNSSLTRAFADCHVPRNRSEQDTDLKHHLGNRPTLPANLAAILVRWFRSERPRSMC